jgi:Excalibur calcium-binding domain
MLGPHGRIRSTRTLFPCGVHSSTTPERTPGGEHLGAPAEAATSFSPAVVHRFFALRGDLQGDAVATPHSPPRSVARPPWPRPRSGAARPEAPLPRSLAALRVGSDATPAPPPSRDVGAAGGWRRRALPRSEQPSPWPLTVALRHVAAAPNCNAARVVGLAPARRGQPGYWPSHDRDGDGIACEPWRPR